MKPPDFLMARPVDIGRVGDRGANILALVRYVNGLPGEVNGRKLIDGEMWWRATREDIGEALGGVSEKSVGGGLRKLEEAGELLAIPANSFLGDRANRYRVPDLPSDESGTGSDLPSDENVPPIGRKRPLRSDENVRSDRTKSSDLPSLGELEEEGEKASAAESAEPLDVETVPGDGNAPPPPDSSEDQTEPLDGVAGGTVLDGEIVEPDCDPRPEPKCKRHPDGDVGEPCHACKRDNEELEAWKQRRKDAARLRSLSSVAESPRVERSAPEPKPPPPSWIHGPYGPRCPPHGHHKVAPADCDRCRVAAIAAKESA